jgi:hypothetical protein
MFTFLPRKIYLLSLMLLSLNGFSQQIAHVRQIKKEVFSEPDNDWICPERRTFYYMHGFLSSSIVEKTKADYMGGELNLSYGYKFFYDQIFRAQRIYLSVTKGTDTLTPAERLVTTLNKDSLIGFFYRQAYYPDEKDFHSTYKSPYFYFANYSMKGYEAFQPDATGGWQSWYRELADSVNKQKTKFFFQDIRDGVYKTSANEYFDSIKVKNNMLQFIFRDDDVDQTADLGEMGYDKYVFNLDGSFHAYEAWERYAEEKKWSNNLIETFESDESGRPSASVLITPPLEDGEGATEEHYSYSYEPDESLNTSPIVLNRKGDLLFVDWCADTGDETVMLLIDKNMKINYYGTFPMGQPFMRTSKMPKGEYYLCVFNRSAQLGGMVKLTL